MEAIITQNVSVIDLNEVKSNEASRDNLKDNIIQKEHKKEDIFAELLRKRNNKFNKLWGTKILVKYDSRNEAKQMLRG